MTDKELYDIAIYIKEQATPEELKEFKHLEQHEDRIAWVENQIAKLDKGEILL
jgi:superfamily I DNA and RNA helicase